MARIWNALVAFADWIVASIVVTQWPLWMRRTFIVTLPISGPLYIAWALFWLVFAAFAGTAFVLFWFLILIPALCVVAAFASAFIALRDLWAA